MTARRWLPGELELLQEMYPHTPTERIAQMMRRPVRSVYAKANALSLKKTKAYYRTHVAGRLHQGHSQGKDTRFQAGQTPWNKGTHWSSGGRSVETRFKPGRPPEEARNYRPIGTTRICKSGYLERKTTDDQRIVPARRWEAVHRLVWEAERGPVPDGHVVRFRDGLHTTVEDQITIDRLECLSWEENMRRNSHHTNYPPEVSQVIQLRGVLTRKIRNREHSNAEK